jgi:hypothetical protein
MKQEIQSSILLSNYFNDRSAEGIHTFITNTYFVIKLLSHITIAAEDYAEDYKTAYYQHD